MHVKGGEFSWQCMTQCVPMCVCVCVCVSSQVGLMMKMFQTLGTPTEEVWPGVGELLRDDLEGELPYWPARSLAQVCD